MSDDPMSDCPECDGHVHRVVQPVGIIFKGSGFYVTDNRQSSSSTLVPPKEADKTKAEPSAGEAKTETAAAKKSEPAVGTD
jgi:predicted nucleic acid-binding Zn ribbon protein